MPDSIKALLVEPQRPQSPLRPSDDDEDDSKASGQVRRSLSSRLATQGERGCWKGRHTLGEADRTGVLTIDQCFLYLLSGLAHIHLAFPLSEI